MSLSSLPILGLVAGGRSFLLSRLHIAAIYATILLLPTSFRLLVLPFPRGFSWNALRKSREGDRYDREANG